MHVEIINTNISPTIPAEQPTTIESEHQTRNPVLLLGGGHGTGEALAKLLVASGRDVFIGTRSSDSYDRLRNELPQAEGSVKPFIADIKDPEEVRRALSLANLPEGQPIDYFPLAAGGFDPIPIQFAIGRAYARIKHQMDKPEGITRDFAQAETEKMKEFMLRLSSREEAWRINATAPVDIAKFLMDNGNLDSTSTIIVLDSTISKYAQTVIPYPGPWLYYIVGISKAKGSLTLREMARKTGSTFIDFIAPGIADTKAGEFFERFIPVLKALQELKAQELKGQGLEIQDRFEFPMPPASEIAQMMFNEITRKRTLVEARETDLYLGYNKKKKREVSHTPPPGFRTPTVDWL